MVKLVPKPDLRRVLAAIRDQTRLGTDLLAPVVGASTYDVEQAVRTIVTKAIEAGIDLQRDAIVESTDDVDTPLIPPPSEGPEPPIEEAPTKRIRLPQPPKLPTGIKG